MKKIIVINYLFIVSIISISCTDKPKEPISCDILIYNGTVYDGSGAKPFNGSVAIKDLKIIYLMQIQLLMHLGLQYRLVLLIC